MATDTLNRSAGNMTAMILTILNVFLIPVFFFYLVSENSYWKSILKTLVPKPYYARVTQVFNTSTQLLKSYLQGQFLACTALSILYGFSLQIAGLKFGVLIGIITGSLSFIPYVGFSLGLVIVIIVAFSMGLGFGFVAIIIAIFFIIQTIETFIITPKLVGIYIVLTPLES